MTVCIKSIKHVIQCKGPGFTHKCSKKQTKKNQDFLLSNECITIFNFGFILIFLTTNCCVDLLNGLFICCLYIVFEAVIVEIFCPLFFDCYFELKGFFIYFRYKLSIICVFCKTFLAFHFLRDFMKEQWCLPIHYFSLAFCAFL